jgi:hypothetical protein
MLVKPSKSFVGGLIKCKVRIFNKGTRAARNVAAMFPVPAGVTIIHASVFYPVKKGQRTQKKQGAVVWSNVFAAAHGYSIATIVMKIDKAYSGDILMNSFISRPNTDESPECRLESTIKKVKVLKAY